MLEMVEKSVAIMVGLVTTIGIIFGSIYAKIEYEEHKKELAQERVFDLIKEFNENDIKNSIENIRDSYLSKISITPEAYKNDESYYIFTIKLITSQSLQNDVDHILDFYDRVYNCTDLSLCDRDVTEHFFYKSSVVFFRQFSPYLCLVRAEWNDKNLWSHYVNFIAPDYHCPNFDSEQS